MLSPDPPLHSPARPMVHVCWPTLALLVGVWGVWAGALALPAGWGAVGFALLVPALVLHSSLSHEILHGHPFGIARLDTALGLWQPGLFVPYLRFKRTHLAHHRDANLTDPYDDPESNYLDPARWARLGRWQQWVLGFNNTLLGRMTVGPLIGTAHFVAQDGRAIRAGAPHVARDWLAHLPGVALTLAVVAWSPLPIWLYLLACYCALSVLKIRSFLEHRAHAHVAARTVIIEDSGVLAFLFLNNSLHVVHHMHPEVPWYRLRALYGARRARYLGRNGGYVYRSYGAVFRRYFLTRKDPVAHPLWPGPEG